MDDVRALEANVELVVAPGAGVGGRDNLSGRAHELDLDASEPATGRVIRNSASDRAQRLKCVHAA